MAESLHAQIRRKALIAGGLLLLVLVSAPSAYKHIGGEQVTVLDSLYMVVITIATIGYGEIVDLSHSPGGRIFTMFLSFAASHHDLHHDEPDGFVVEGQLNEAFRRRKMEKRIEKLREHYIVCGADGGRHARRAGAHGDGAAVRRRRRRPREDRAPPRRRRRAALRGRGRDGQRDAGPGRASTARTGSSR